LKKIQLANGTKNNNNWRKIKEKSISFFDNFVREANKIQMAARTGLHLAGSECRWGRNLSLQGGRRCLFEKLLRDFWLPGGVKRRTGPRRARAAQIFQKNENKNKPELKKEK
jgi:hypothetical protein